MVEPVDARLQDHRRARADHRPDRPGPRAEGHPVRRQHQEPRLQHVRAGAAGLGQDHGRQGAPRTARPPRHRRRPTGSTSTTSRTPTGRRRCKLPHGRAKALGQGHGRRDRRAAQRAAGAVRGRGLPGAPARHRRAVPVGPGGGARGAEQEGAGQNIAILRTPTGFTMAPMHEGKVVKPEVFNALPEAMRKDVESKIEALQKELEAILERLPKTDKKRRAQLQRAQRGGGQARRSRGARRPAWRRSPTCPRPRLTSRPPAPTWCATSGCSSQPARRRTPSSSSRSTPRATPASAATWSTSWSPDGDGVTAARRSSRSSTRPTATSSAASSTSPRWARWSPISC